MMCLVNVFVLFYFVYFVAELKMWCSAYFVCTYTADEETNTVSKQSGRAESYL